MHISSFHRKTILFVSHELFFKPFSASYSYKEQKYDDSHLVTVYFDSEVLLGAVT